MGVPLNFGVFAFFTALAAVPAQATERAPLKLSDCQALVDESAGDPSKVDERCFVIGSVRVEEDETEGTPAPFNRLGGLANISRFSDAAGGGPAVPANKVDMILNTADHILLIGGKIWKFIVANRAEAEVAEATADALPAGAKSPDQLQSWKTPQVRTFHVVYTNLVGLSVVDFEYRIQYTYGGRIAGRKGHYLANVQVQPGTLRVLWGFRFDFEGGAMKALNVGTSADPVAAIEMLARWKVSNPINTLGDSASFFIKGDGSFEPLTDAAPVTP